MIPPFASLLAGYIFLARRRGIKQPLDPVLAHSCLRVAANLAQRPEDEPAALFYAFCRSWMKLGDACTIWPDVLARSHAGALRLHLQATAFELRMLRLEVSADMATYDETREWFAERLAPD